MNTPMPIIRLEVDGMRHSMAVALSEYSAQMDANLQRAVQEFCTPENIDRIIKRAADQVLTQTIQEEVHKFFRFGEGRNAIAAVVKENLLKKETYTPLDEVP